MWNGSSALVLDPRLFVDLMQVTADAPRLCMAVIAKSLDGLVAHPMLYKPRHANLQTLHYAI
jgi:hypothetical protein